MVPRRRLPFRTIVVGSGWWPSWAPRDDVRGEVERRALTGEPIVGHMPAKPTYLGAVASSAGQGLLTAAWIATGGLTIGQRRALRLTATAAGAASGVIAAG